jgi:hypothetical protein
MGGQRRITRRRQASFPKAGASSTHSKVPGSAPEFLDPVQVSQLRSGLPGGAPCFGVRGACPRFAERGLPRAGRPKTSSSGLRSRRGPQASFGFRVSGWMDFSGESRVGGKPPFSKREQAPRTPKFPASLQILQPRSTSSRRVSGISRRTSRTRAWKFRSRPPSSPSRLCFKNRPPPSPYPF